jgi:hypothetical protein
MKTSASVLLVAAVLVGCASSASLVQMHVQYSDALVNVGDLDIFGATWQKIYATDGNDKGAINDDTYSTYSDTCKSEAEPQTDLAVRMEMNGAWGANDETNITSYQMRDAIVQTAWAAYQQLAVQKQYDVYTNCSGFTWFESVLYTASAPCGPSSSIACPSACDSGMLQCMNHSYGLYLPSTLRVSAYLDDELLADSITFTLSSAETAGFDDGCGIVGTISANLASFIPVVGSLFAAGIEFECS